MDEIYQEKGKINEKNIKKNCYEKFSFDSVKK